MVTDKRSTMGREMYGAFCALADAAEPWEALSAMEHDAWEGVGRRAYELFAPNVPGNGYSTTEAEAGLRTAALLLLGACFSMNRPPADPDRAIPVNLDIVIDVVTPLFERAGITWGSNARDAEGRPATMYPSGAPRVHS